MRRKDREVTGAAAIDDIINRCYCCRLGLCDEGEVYIVPLSFGYEMINGGYVFYFHGANEGRKLDIICKNPHAGFEMDTNYALNEAEAACGYSARFQSIIGKGIASIVTGREEKLHGLRLLMEHYAGKGERSFDERAVNAVTVFKLEVTELSCKEHK